MTLVNAMRTRRCRSDAGLGAVSALVTVVVLAAMTFGSVAGYRAVIRETHRIAGSANAQTIAQAAKVDEVINGTDPHDALVAAAAECACGVTVATFGTTLVYRNGSQLVQFDSTTGATGTRVVDGSDSQPDISTFDGTPHWVPINLDPAN